jgi:hypothetical protein
MNYKKMRDASMNYQLDQNRAFNYQRQPFFPLLSVNGPRDRHVPFYMGACWNMVVVHGGMLENGGSLWEENRKKMKIKHHFFYFFLSIEGIFVF